MVTPARGTGGTSLVTTVPDTMGEGVATKSWPAWSVVTFE
jgi:hypothetical protein